MVRPSWDQTFLRLVNEFKQRSKDQSTKVGAVIVGHDNDIRSMGYNCFPRRVRDDIESRWEKENKLFFVVHAERNAIDNAARAGIRLSGCRLYCNWMPCSNCMGSIIQAGISEVIVETTELIGKLPIWVRSVYFAWEQAKESGVIVRLADTTRVLSASDFIVNTDMGRVTLDAAFKGT